MDLDHGGRQLAGLILAAAGNGQHDQVAELIAPLDAEQLRSLVTVLAVQVDQSAPPPPPPAPPRCASWPSTPRLRCSAPPRRRSAAPNADDRSATPGRWP
ncbi:hypothetical protein GCM10007231_06360 [Nocardioides daphniae]|uniref:Uncharacterized protein n=1 Tax=Nocardioides daphniae TaxID=402297 RepID=A0ABQ1Q3A1_9ACTN|nr:hypothetical protein GCM10007231_06360 [Nocardioides daphniae]